MKWQQRSKQKWLKERDKNTRYFHSYAILRKKNSTINKITDEEGHKYTISQEINSTF